jgi:hypothetical protein
MHFRDTYKTIIEVTTPVSRQRFKTIKTPFAILKKKFPDPCHAENSGLSYNSKDELY